MWGLKVYVKSLIVGWLASDFADRCFHPHGFSTLCVSFCISRTRSTISRCLHGLINVVPLLLLQDKVYDSIHSDGYTSPMANLTVNSPGF